MFPKKILTIHTRYLQSGGEDVVFDTEAALLRRFGHEVVEFTADNLFLMKMHPLKMAVNTLWSWEYYRQIANLLEETRPDVVHLHNTFPLLSPSVIDACHRSGVPVVMTLHNYRLLCVNALLYRQGMVCEACLGRLPWRGVMHRCYRQSRVASAVVASMLILHRLRHTWNKVNRFIVLTEFSRNKFIEGGLPAENMVVKPNFIYPDPGLSNRPGLYALFVGRLSAEKGIRTLLKTWTELGVHVPLRIVGDGPLAEAVRQVVASTHEVEWLGKKTKSEVINMMKEASFLVFPSEWYESFGLTVIESCACGRPVLASNIGTMADLVEGGKTGLYFEAGNPLDLAEKVNWAWTHPEEMAEMGMQARAEFEAKYTAERNYQMLMEIYRAAIEENKSRA